MDSATIRTLAELAHLAPSADNSQPWRLQWDGDSLAVLYDRTRMTDSPFPAQGHAHLLSIGGLLETLVATATAWQMDPALELAESPGAGDPALYARLRFARIPREPAVTDDCQAIRARHTDRGQYRSTVVPAELLPRIAAQTLGEARVVFSQERELREQAADLVRDASLIRFQTPEVHQWLDHSLRFGREAEERRDGLDVATMGLPPGGGLLLRLISPWSRMRRLNALGFHRLLAGVDSAPLRRGPGLLAVVGSGGAEGTIDAGRLLWRTWTDLNAAGLSVQPYYVISDQLNRLEDNRVPSDLVSLAQTIKRETRTVFQLGENEHLHMLLRVGYSRKPPKRALRLPVDTVFADLTP
jgi:hypothetical protein